eukprot:COSAG02_NODE_1139_length_14295_cov_63.689279_11_plen_789_part_00
MMLVVVAHGLGTVTRAGDGSCTAYQLAYTGCDSPPNVLQCARIAEVHNSTQRSAPPYGKRFMYDTGNRTISRLYASDVDECAFQCLLEPACRGFTLVDNSSCFTVNDVERSVSTTMASMSYVLTRREGCRPDCGSGDGMALQATTSSQRPIAAGGGLRQCQQHCDIAEAAEPGSCAGVVYEPGVRRRPCTKEPCITEILSGPRCSLVNGSAVWTTVSVLTSQQSFLRRAARGTPTLATWVVDSSLHVFEAARPSQTLFCPPRHDISWAAVAGTFISSQLALLSTYSSATATFTVSNLTSSLSTGAHLASSTIELAQVGLINVETSPGYEGELGGKFGWYPDLLQPLGQGYPSSIELTPNNTRALHIGITVPSRAPPGEYHGSLIVQVHSATDENMVVTQLVRIKLTVWPISGECVAKHVRRFGAAYGFDHPAVDLIWPGRSTEMHRRIQDFTARRHISSNSLLMQDGINVTLPTVASVLRVQDMFVADAMYLSNIDAKYLGKKPNKTWIDEQLEQVDERMERIKSWGLENQSVIYGPDELELGTAPGIRLLFDMVKQRWPQTQRMAVIDWAAERVLSSVDILVVQYQLLDRGPIAASRDAYESAGKRVWGYHCVSPAQNNFLNSFIDVPVMKSRLIPWFAAQYNLSGWLYWFTNFGWRHSPSAHNSAGKFVPLRILDQRTGRSNYDAHAYRGGGWTNSDGNLLYPGVHGPLSSIRLEAYRRGLEDRALMMLLTSKQRTELSRRLVRSASNWSIDEVLMEQTRRDAAALIGSRMCASRDSAHASTTAEW